NLAGSTATPLTVTSNSSVPGIKVLGLGSGGTATGQLYVAGSVPSTTTGSVVPGGSNLSSVYVQGRYAFVTNAINNSNLYIYDVSNPASPASISSIAIPTGHTPNSVYVQGRYAYVADSQAGGLYIYDISNPAVPALAGSVVVAHFPNAMYVQGRYAYLTD